MDRKELAYAKQGVMATKNWDCFQRLIRRCLRGDDTAESSSLPAHTKLMHFGYNNLFPSLDTKRITRSLVVAVLIVGVTLCFALPGLAKSRTRQNGPAIVIVAFGTTTDARATYNGFEEQLKRELPAPWSTAPISWAFTSEIVRERANKKFAENGDSQRYRSLLQVLADLEDQGYRQIAVQSLHIFPGQEFDDMERDISVFRDLGLRIEYGGTLLHTWERTFAALRVVEPEFLPFADGCSILVTHGTPETFSGANGTYLGLDRYLSRKFGKVFVGTVEGVLTREQALAQAKSCSPARVRIVPFMYVAGDHVMNDIMGEKADEEGLPSWAMELRSANVAVEAVTTEHQGRTVYKGLGLYPEINRIFIKQLIDSLERLK